MLSEERGRAAVAKLASRLHPHGAGRAIEEAFDRRLMEIEADWRARLAGSTERSHGRRRRHLYRVEGDGGKMPRRD
jgi:hypothetical protein